MSNVSRFCSRSECGLSSTILELRDLHAKYQLLIGDLQTMVDSHRSEQRPAVSSHLFRPL